MFLHKINAVNKYSGVYNVAITFIKDGRCYMILRLYKLEFKCEDFECHLFNKVSS